MKFLILIAVLGFPVQYPESTKTMTDAEFYTWAVKTNKAAAEARVETTDRYIYSWGTETVGNRFGTHKTRTRLYRYNNPDYVWPGPLTIVNPYVHPRSMKCKH